MAKFGFTKSAIEVLPTPSEQEAKKVGYVLHWDSHLPGLGLKITVNGVKIFVFNYRNAAGRGRRYTIGRYGRFTLDQARSKARKLLGDVANGEDPVDQKKEIRKASNFDELMQRYIEEHIKPHCSEYALRSARRVRRILRPSLGHRLVYEIDDTHVRAALKEFTSQSGNWNVIRTYIGSAWSWGRKHRVISKNLSSPVEDIEIMPTEPQARIVTEGEYGRIFGAIDKFLANSKHDPARLLAILWVIYTGCRPIEAVRLKRQYVYMDRGFAELYEHKTYRKTKKPKKFFLTAPLLDLIDRADALRKMRGIESDFVFPRRSKQKASNWLAKTWAGVQNEANVDIDLRQMRSAYINSADDLGLSDKEILEMTQHMSESVVKRHYSMFKDKRGAKNAQVHSQMLQAMRTVPSS